MSNGIAHNNLNDISKLYLDTISDINKKEQADDVNRWQQEESGCETKPSPFKKKKYKEDWHPEIEHSKLGDAKKKADKKRESKLPPHLQGDAIGKMKKAFANEGYSNWRTSLREVTSDAEATEIDDQPEIKEKKVKNKIKINPEFKEAVKQMGGELLEVTELDDKKDDKKDEQDAAAAKKIADKERKLKMRILRVKMMATKQDAGASIVAGYEPKVNAIKKLVKEGNALEKRAKENEKARKWLKKDAKDSGYTDIALKASMSKGAGVSEGSAYGLWKGDGKRKLPGDKKKEEVKKEEYTVTNADKKGNTPAWQGYKSGKKNAKTGKPLYKKADHVKEGHWEYHEPDGLKRFSDFIQEGNPTTRMMNKSKTQTTGNISADRGTDAKKNKESRKGLEKDLKKKGIGYKKGTGEYKYDDGSKGREVSYQTSPGKGMSKRRFGKVMRRLGRKHGQESVITKDKDKPARLHDTESKKPGKSANIGKSKPGKHPSGSGETSGTKVRGKKLSKTTNKPSYHYG